MDPNQSPILPSSLSQQFLQKSTEVRQSQLSSIDNQNYLYKYTTQQSIRNLSIENSKKIFNSQKHIRNSKDQQSKTQSQFRLKTQKLGIEHKFINTKTPDNLKDQLATLYKNMLSPESHTLIDEINQLKNNPSLDQLNKTQKTWSLSQKFIKQHFMPKISNGINSISKIDSLNQMTMSSFMANSKSQPTYLTEQSEYIDQLPLFQQHFSIMKSEESKALIKRKIKYSLSQNQHLILEQARKQINQDFKVMQKSLFQINNQNKDERWLMFQVIDEMIEGKIQPNEILSQETRQGLQEESELYRGIMISSKNQQKIQNVLNNVDEEFVIKSQDHLEKYLQERDQNNLINAHYRRNLERLIFKKNKLLGQDQKLNQSSTFRQQKNSNIQQFFQLKVNDTPNRSIQEFIEENQDQHTLLFILHQELLKQVSILDKDLATALQKLFVQYFNLKEKMWTTISLEAMGSVIEKLQSERDLLLCKYKYDEKVSNIQSDIKYILNNQELSMDNLTQHKIAIQTLIGEYFDLDDQNWCENLKSKYFEKETRDLLWNWDHVRLSDRCKRNIQLVDPKNIVETLMFTDEYRNLDKDQFAVLVNAQRLLMSLKNKNPWAGEMEFYRNKNKSLMDQIDELQQKCRYLEETHKADQRIMVIKEDQILNLQESISNVTGMIAMKDCKSIEIQTEFGIHQKKVERSNQFDSSLDSFDTQRSQQSFIKEIQHNLYSKKQQIYSPLYQIFKGVKDRILSQDNQERIIQLLLSSLEQLKEALVNQSQDTLTNIFEEILSSSQSQILEDFLINQNADMYQIYDEFYQGLKQDKVVTRISLEKGMKIKIEMNLQPSLSLEFIMRNFSQIEMYLARVFKEYDTNGDGLLQFAEFGQILRKIDKNFQAWRIISLFNTLAQKNREMVSKQSNVSELSNLEIFQREPSITLEQFIGLALSNDLAEKVVEIYKSSEFCFTKAQTFTQRLARGSLKKRISKERVQLK